MLDRGKLAAPSDDFFSEDPVRLIELFHLADLHGLAIHPLTMREAGRDIGLIAARVRRDPRAHALFLDVLTSTRAAGKVLRCLDGKSAVEGKRGSVSVDLGGGRIMKDKKINEMEA